jgi:putative acetyltransferase
MDIRREQPDDHAAVATVHQRAFGDHGDAVARLVDALRQDDPDALSFVAEARGELVGHVMFSRGLLDAPRRLVPIQVLSPLAVLPEQQRRGIGSALIRTGLGLLDQRGVPLVFLEGDPRYYSWAGFAPGGDHGFRKPSLRDPDA